MKPWKKNYNPISMFDLQKYSLDIKLLSKLKSRDGLSISNMIKNIEKLPKSLTGRQNVMQYRTASIFDFDTSFISVDHRHVKNDKR